MRRGACASFEPCPFRSSSDARAAVISVHRNARSDGVLSRSSIPHTFVHSNTSSSRSDAVLFRSGTPLSLSLSLLLSISWVHHSLTVFIIRLCIFRFFTTFLDGLGSVSCVYLDSFVMRPATSGTPGSHSSAGNFPRLPDTP